MASRHSLFVSIAVLAAGASVAVAQEAVKPLKVTAVEFTSTPAPAAALEMTQPYTRSEAIITLADGSLTPVVG